MTPSPSVLIGLSVSDDVGERVAGWVRHLGYEPTVTLGGCETLAWVQERAFAASLLDAGLVAEAGEPLWRRVRPIAGRRLVLMVREPRRDLWFEALGTGVGAVLPMPPEESMVRAALDAAVGLGLRACASMTTGRRVSLDG